MSESSAGSPEANRAALNTRWELTDARIAAAVAARHEGLTQDDLTEDEIARIAVEMSTDAP
jgi:hypothetical protein